MVMRIDNLLFKKLIMIFWTLWWIIAFWTDIVGALAHLHLVQASWAPDSNYPFLVASLKMYQVKPWVPALAFMGILLWSALCTGAFCFASISLHKPKAVWLPRARTAFIISLLYWMAFFLADQVVMK